MGDRPPTVRHRTPMSGLTRKQLAIQLGDAHELMVRAGTRVLWNPDCPACTVPPNMYRRLLEAQG